MGGKLQNADDRNQKKNLNTQIVHVHGQDELLCP